jgi:hypothetical protein
MQLSKNIRWFLNMRRLRSVASSSDSAISEPWPVLNNDALASDLDRQFGDLPGAPAQGTSEHHPWVRTTPSRLLSL